MYLACKGISCYKPAAKPSFGALKHAGENGRVPPLGAGRSATLHANRVPNLLRQNKPFFTWFKHRNLRALQRVCMLLLRVSSALHVECDANSFAVHVQEADTHPLDASKQQKLMEVCMR